MAEILHQSEDLDDVPDIPLARSSNPTVTPSANRPPFEVSGEVLSTGPSASTTNVASSMQDGQVNVEHLGPFTGPSSDAPPTQDPLPGQTQPTIPPIPTELEAQATSDPCLLPGGPIVNLLAEGVAIAVATMLPAAIFPKDLSQLDGYNFVSFLLSIRVIIAYFLPLVLAVAFIVGLAPTRVGIVGCIASYHALISMVPGVCEGGFVYCCACSNLFLCQLAIGSSNLGPFGISSEYVILLVYTNYLFFSLMFRV
jgi:hypothetical protein